MERQKIVAVGREGGLLDYLEDLFAETAVEVQRFGNAEHALALLESFDIDLVLVEHPLGEHRIQEFVVQAAGKLGGATQKIMVLAKDEAVGELIDSVGDRFPVVSCDEPTRFRKRIAPHLRAWPQRAQRLMVTMQVRLGAVGLHRMAQTENLSETGVFIRTGDKVPVGSEIDLELSLPGGAEPIRAVGEVMRYQEAKDGEVGGLGVAFTRLTTDAADRLNTYLDERLAEAAS
ncbi:MAG: hypothetical protein GY769_23590 [bacterium]|nr:hypothetical protein [bacterium]